VDALRSLRNPSWATLASSFGTYLPCSLLKGAAGLLVECAAGDVSSAVVVRCKARAGRSSDACAPVLPKPEPVGA
jgi:hypothetical protein